MEKIKIEVECFEFLTLIEIVDNVLIDDYKEKLAKRKMKEMDAFIFISLCGLRNKMKLIFRKTNLKTYEKAHCQDEKTLEADGIEKHIDRFPLELRKSAYNYFIKLNKKFSEK